VDEVQFLNQTELHPHSSFKHRTRWSFALLELKLEVEARRRYRRKTRVAFQLQKKLQASTKTPSNLESPSSSIKSPSNSLFTPGPETTALHAQKVLIKLI
jgi:hypothetical protein